MRHTSPTTSMRAFGISASTASSSVSDGDQVTVWSVVAVLLAALVLLQVLVATGGAPAERSSAQPAASAADAAKASAESGTPMSARPQTLR